MARYVVPHDLARCLSLAASAGQPGGLRGWWFDLAWVVASFIFVLLVLIWTFLNRRWIRVKGIIAIALSILVAPALTVVIRAMGLEVSFGEIAWPSVVVAVVGIGVLAALEWQAGMQTKLHTTLDAFSSYMRLVVHNRPIKERLKLLRSFRNQRDIDPAVFELCQVAELMLNDSVDPDHL